MPNRILNIKRVKCALPGIFLSLVGISLNIGAEEIAVEWAPFIKAANVTDEQLVTAANSVNNNFLILQKGFIKRELIKKNDNEYADIIYWMSNKDAIAAADKVSGCTKCNEYFKLMEVDEKAGEGFSHYIIIKSWNR